MLPACCPLLLRLLYICVQHDADTKQMELMVAEVKEEDNKSKSDKKFGDFIPEWLHTVV